MIFHRLTVQLGLALLMTSPVAALVQPAAAQPPPPKPAKTGVLAMAKDGTRGSVVYEDAFDAVYKAALQVAETQGEVAAADSAGGTIQASVGPLLPDGSQLSLSVALSKLPDGRIQVQVTSRDPGPGTPVVGPSKKATRSYVEALTANLAGKPLPAKPVRVYIFTAPTEPGLDGRKDAIADLEHCLAPLPIDMVPEAAKDMAKVWLEVVRKDWDEGLTVRLTVQGTGYSTEWATDSPRDIGKARNIKHLFDGWLDANRERLITGQRTQPLPAGRVCKTGAGSPIVGPSSAHRKVTLFLGSAPPIDGFVNFNSSFDDSYRDLCSELASRPILTPAATRDEADLILEMTFRNAPEEYHHAAVRAALFVVGSDARIELSARVPAARALMDSMGREQPQWRSLASELLRQAVVWIDTNGAALEKARATRPSKLPRP